MNEDFRLIVYVSAPWKGTGLEENFLVEREGSVDVDTQVRDIVERGATDKRIHGGEYFFHPPHRITGVKVLRTESG